MSEFIGNCIYFALGIIALPWIIAYAMIAFLVLLAIGLGKGSIRGFAIMFKRLTQEIR